MYPRRSPPTRQYSLGILMSTGGVSWSPFNTGSTSAADGLSEGGLAIDGNRVFAAMSDGKAWYYDSDDVLFAAAAGAQLGSTRQMKPLR